MKVSETGNVLKPCTRFTGSRVRRHTALVQSGSPPPLRRVPRIKAAPGGTSLWRTVGRALSAPPDPLWVCRLGPSKASAERVCLGQGVEGGGSSLPLKCFREESSLPLKGLREGRSSLPLKGLREESSLPLKGLREGRSSLPLKGLHQLPLLV